MSTGGSLLISVKVFTVYLIYREKYWDRNRIIVTSVSYDFYGKAKARCLEYEVSITQFLGL